MSKDMQIDFYVNNKLYAMRYSSFVPCIGDRVRFKHITYMVGYRIFIYDEDEPRVAVDITKIKTEVELKTVSS